MSDYHFPRDFPTPGKPDRVRAVDGPGARGAHPPSDTAPPAPARCVALVGCDGSGKSTLAHDLVARLGQHAPTTSVYLGLGTGELGRRLARMPVIGPLVGRFFTRKAAGVHDNPEGRLPGPATALVMLGFSLARRHRFRRVAALRGRGIQVVTDRYPQAEVAGAFDGPGLAWTRKGATLSEALARRERAIYQAMAALPPTLVIRLNVDIDTALARKPDHDRALLEKKVAVMAKLTFGGARIVEVDATRPYPEALETVLDLLRRCGVPT
ncbi:hypothetical protein MTR62_08175 [Novosphingobium sp. 1949]|uniref:Thymidylate kinase n=1 Tax=Novosphingobium organovorum TaxID=2930092 RepID=A0ABT0BCI8_9SPHN|nr:hypothetical protein [Novosphingobium organovorum]MCJ2182664.1 hypothetical protein [Novosphingobium organovorum]